MEKNDLVKFRSECLSAHNFYRSLHATTPLIWSSKLADGAQRWAEELASADSLTYSHERGVGENIACLWGSDVTGNKVTQIWYEEAKHYDYSVPRVTPITRPFCQVIWEGSRELGAGKSTTKNGKQIVVARYNPPATRRNAERNVKKPRLDRIDGDSSLVPHSLGLRKFQEECLFAHNEFRVLHGSPPLHWSPSLAWAAQQWAEELVRMGELKHNDDEMVGENLAGMVGDELTGKECTDMWYDEVSEYDYDSPGYSEDTSNFTQVVWIGSELFGVGRATYGDLCVVVAFYEPPGNMEGLFADNVRKAGTRVKSYRLIKEAKTFIPPSPDLDWFRIECLVAHNYFRARHGATPLVIAHGLNEEAQYWAERLLVTGATEDLQESRIGINVAVIEGQHVSGLKVAELWYQESTSYDFDSPGFKLETRSFTQLLWLTSRKLGVGKACNDNGQCVVVARYEPVGNIDGLFVNNVRKRGHERNTVEPVLFESDVKYRIKVNGRRSLRMSWEVEGAMLQAENKHHDQTRRKEQSQPAYMSSPETFTRLVWIESPVLPRRRMRPESGDLEKEDLDKSDEDKESGVEEGEEFDNEGTEPEPEEGRVMSRVAYFEQFEKMEEKPKRSSVELKPEVKKTEEHEETVCQLEYDDVFPKHDERDERDDDFASEEEAEDDDDDGMSLETVSEADEDLLGELDEFEMDHHIKSYCYEQNYVRDQDEDNTVDENQEETENRDSSPDHCYAVSVKREQAAEEHLKNVDHIFEFIPRNIEKQNKNVDLKKVDLTDTEKEQELFKFETTTDKPGRYSGPVCKEEVLETHREKRENNLDEMVTRFDEKPKSKPPPTLPKPQRSKQEISNKQVETNKVIYTLKAEETVPETVEEKYSTVVEPKEELPKDDKVIYTQKVEETAHETMEERHSIVVEQKEELPKEDEESVPETEGDKYSTCVEQEEEVPEEDEGTFTQKATETVEEKYSEVVEQKEEIPKEDEIIYTQKATETFPIEKQKEEVFKETELSNDEEEAAEFSDGEAMEVIDIAHIDRDRRVHKILNRLGRHIDLIPLEQSPKKGDISKDIDLTESEDEKALFDFYTPPSDKRSWSTSPVEEEMITAQEKLKVESEIPWEELFKDEDESSEKEEEDESKTLETFGRPMPPEKRRSVSFKETVIVQEHEAFREEPLQDEYEYCEEESEEDLKTYGEEFEDPFEAKAEDVQERSAGSPVFVSHEVEVEETTEVVNDERDNEEENAGTFEEEEDPLKVETAADQAQSICFSEEPSEEEDQGGVVEQQYEDSVADDYAEHDTSHANLAHEDSPSSLIHITAEVERNEPVDTGLLEEESIKTTVHESFEEIRPRSSSTEVVVPSSCHVTSEIEIQESEVRPIKEVEVDTLSEEEPEIVDNVVVHGIPESSESTICITTETTYRHNTEIVHKRMPSVEVDVYNEEEVQAEEPRYKEVLPNGHCTTTYITHDVEDATLEETVESETEQYQEKTPGVIDEADISGEEFQREEDDEDLEEEPLSEEELLEDEIITTSQAADVCSSPVVETEESRETVEDQPSTLQYESREELQEDVVEAKTEDKTESSFAVITQHESNRVIEMEESSDHQAEVVEQKEEQEPQGEEDEERMEKDSITVEEAEQSEKVESEEEPEEAQTVEQYLNEKNQEKQEPHIEDDAEETYAPVNTSRVETEHETIELEDGGLVSKSVTREETSTVEEDDSDNSTLTKKIITRTFVTTTTTSRTVTSDEPLSISEDVQDFVNENNVPIDEIPEQESQPEPAEEKVTEEDARETEPIAINIQENKEINQEDETDKDKVTDEEEQPIREEIDDNRVEESVEEEDEHLLQPKFSDDRFGYISEEELEETEELYTTLRQSSEEQEYEEKVDVENVYLQQTVPGVVLMANQEDEKFEPSEDDIAYDSEVITEVEKEITSALVVKESFSSPIYDDGETKTEEQRIDPLHPVEFVDDTDNVDESFDKDEEILERSPEENEDVESSDENVTEKVQLVEFTEETEVKQDFVYEQPKDESREHSPTRSFEEEEEEEEELESSGELMEENVELIQFSERDNDDKVEQVSTEPFERTSPSPSDDDEKEIESSEENVEESVELIQFSERDAQEDVDEDKEEADEDEKAAESSEEIVEESVELIQFSETSEEEKIVEFDNSKEEFVGEKESKTVELIQFTEQDEEEKSEENTKKEADVIHLSKEQVEEQITREEKCVAPCIPIVLTESTKTEQHEDELCMLKDEQDRDFIAIMDAPLACSTPIDVADARSDDTFDDSGEAGFGENYDVIDKIIAHDDLDELQRSLDVSHDSFRHIEAEEVATKAVAEAEGLDDSLQSPRPQEVDENVTATEQEKAELVDLSLFENDKDKESESSEDHVSPPPTIFATEFVAEEEEEGSDEEYIPHFDHPRIYMVEEKELVIDPSVSESQPADTVDSSFKTDNTMDTEYPSEISTASELSQAIDHEVETSHSTIVHSPTSDLDELEEEDKELVHRRQEKMEEVFLQEEIEVQSSHQEEEELEKREERMTQVSYATTFSAVITRHETPEEQHYREDQATVIMQEDEQKLNDKEPKQEDIAADEAMTEDDFRSDGHSSKSDESFDDLDGTQDESQIVTESVYQEEVDVSKLEPSLDEEVSEDQESAPVNVNIDFTEEIEVERVPEAEEAPKSLDDHEREELDEDERDVFQEEVEIQRVEDTADDDIFEEEVEIKRMEHCDEKETHHVREETSVDAVYEEEFEIAAEQRKEDESIEENHGVLLAEPMQSDVDGNDEEREHDSEEDIIRADEVQQEPVESDSPESDQQQHLEEYEIEEEDQAIPHEIQGTNEQDNIYDNNNNESMTRYYVDYSPGASFERDSTASDDGEYPEVYRQGEPMEEDMEEFILVKYGDGHSDSSEEEDLSDHREMYVIPEEDSEERHHTDGEQELKDEPDETVFYEQGFMNPALEDINEEEEYVAKDKDSPKDDEDDIEEKLQLEEYERLESFVMLEEKLSQVESDESMEDLTGGTGEKRASSDETLNDDDELADTTNTSSTLKDEIASKEGSGEESSGELEKTLTTEEEEIIDLEDGGVLSKRTTREESYSVEEMNEDSDGDDDKDKTLTRKRVSKKIITTTTTSATHVTKVPSEEYHSSDEEKDGGKEEILPAQEASKDDKTEEPTKPENTSSIETKEETIELDDGGVMSKSVTREETCTYDDGDEEHGDDDSSVTKTTVTRKIVTTTNTTSSKSTPLDEPTLCLTEGDENSNIVEETASSQPHETVIKSRQNGEELESTKRQLSREGSFAEASVEPLRKRRGFSLEGFDSHDSEGHSSTTDSTGESTGRSNEDLISDEDYSGLDDFQRDCIRQHNIYRHQHRACRLVWSEELSNAAEAWAEHLAATNTLEHTSDKEHGENLASAKGYELRGDKVAEMWYDEVKEYNFEIPAFNAKCGHFTQMIWRDTRQFGVAKSTAADGTQYVVARYYPPGNVLGEFKTSIRRARGQRSSVRKRRRSSARRKTSQTDSGDVITQQEKFKNECIVSHNYYRSLHGAQPLQWSARLAIESQNFAEKLVRSGSFMHSGDKEIGECLSFSFGLELSGRDAVDSWYDEIVDYDYEFPGFTSHTANFTQLVWQGTKEFGMGKAIGDDGSCVVVGRYYPPGNQVGNFQENVKQKQPGYF